MLKPGGILGIVDHRLPESRRRRARTDQRLHQDVDGSPAGRSGGIPARRLVRDQRQSQRHRRLAGRRLDPAAIARAEGQGPRKVPGDRRERPHDAQVRETAIGSSQRENSCRRSALCADVPGPEQPTGPPLARPGRAHISIASRRSREGRAHVSAAAFLRRPDRAVQPGEGGDEEAVQLEDAGTRADPVGRFAVPDPAGPRPGQADEASPLADPRNEPRAVHGNDVGRRRPGADPADRREIPVPVQREGQAGDRAVESRPCPAGSRPGAR